jgi:cytochrome c peroxidase
LVRARIVDLLDDENWDDGSWGPVFVRLAWHAAGTYDAKTKRGGSEGSLMRFHPEKDWAANAGLAFGRSRLESVKKEFPDISFADLWSFAGSVAIEEMGGPVLNWRAGRKDHAEVITVADLPGGLLPDADGRDKKDRPADHLRDIFYRMGFNDREIVALSGAHALGRCHPDRSGYWGPWTNAPTTFSNDYFRLLLEETWTPKRFHEGKPWNGPLQYEDKTGSLMMLPTDLALVQDAKMRPIVEEYSKNEKKFFEDFGKAWIKLQELGVAKFHGPRKYWLFGPRQ